jgi:hypothetical protein
MAEYRGLWRWALVAVSAAVLAGCSSSGTPSASGSASPAPSSPGGSAAAGAASGCPAPSAAPAAETALMLPGLSFDKVGTVTHVTHSAGQFTLQAVSTKPLDELTVLIQDAVTAAGYRPSGMDSEEDEAEVFFTTGTLAAGQARVRQGQCEGQWTIELDLIDPHPTPSPS